MNPSVKSDWWRLVQDVFLTALELLPNERSAYLARACGDDQELHSEVASLLANDRPDAATFRFAVEADLKGLAQATSSSSQSGLRVGPYRLIRELDGGGMGVVYLAVRSDDHYFQIVAIKMVRQGLESPGLVQRFRAERQILATLTHSNIGAILDGGDTEDGRPYIVMEYVEGQPITLASETLGLSIRERVELFRSVCSAVHYAHQTLVIHRDIKPSNVLVTPDGLVKLIDFGISKSLAPELIPGELPPTESSLRLMTPDYASPEQIRGKNVTTATDIYSLGVLLYELLTGSRPYTLRELSPADAERLVLEQEVRKPSSISDLSKRVRKELAGDLDRIILMAMDTDPSRRYPSARDLEEDLLRFLRGEPVLARKPTPIYRLSRFVGRHRTTSLMAGVTLALLLGSLLFYSWQSRMADRHLEQVQTLADSAILDLAEKLQQSSASTEQQASLFQSALTSLKRLRQNSGDDPRLLLAISKAYGRVGDLEGSPFVANLGNSSTAVTSYQEALRAAMEAHARLPGEESTRVVIESYQRLGGIQAFLGNLREAHDSYQKSLSLALDFWKQKADDPIRQRLLTLNYAGLGDVELSALEPDQALTNIRAAFQIFGSEPNGNEGHDRTLTRLYLRMGRVVNEIGPQLEALANVREAIAVAEELVQKFPSSKQVQRDLFSTYQNMVLPLSGRDAMNVGDSRQAQVCARKALAIAISLAAGDSKNAQARYDLALAYTAMGDSFRLTAPATAAGWYRKSIALTKELIPRYGAEARHWIAERDEGLAEVLVRKDQAQERLQLLLEANPIRKELSRTSPHGRLHLMRSYCKVSDAELGVGDLTQARQYAYLSVPFFDEFKPSSPSLLVLRDIGFCYESLGNVQNRIAAEQTRSSAERLHGLASSREWYTKSSNVWKEFNRRGAATLESEAERRKVERLLQTK